MKHAVKPIEAATVTLQHVIDRLQENAALPPSRKRDLKSAVATFAKLKKSPPASIVLDVPDIRRVLDNAVPAQLGVSAKRFANLRSDLAAAIAASGLQVMITTSAIELDPAWADLMQSLDDHPIQRRLSRFARWASLRRIVPHEVTDARLAQFVAEIETATLVRHAKGLHRSIATAWNIVCGMAGNADLPRFAVPAKGKEPTRLPWEELPKSFRDDVDAYLQWCAMPDPLADQARDRRLAPGTLRLRREQIHSAVTAAVAAGIAPSGITKLASLTQVETFRALLRAMWKADGAKLTAYTHGVAGMLITLARERVRAPAPVVEELKKLRRKLGTLPTGLTDKNRALLRRFDDPRIVQAFVDLPDRLWRKAQQGLKTSRRAFIDIQTALAIDLLQHVPMRMENLSVLNFEQHLHWPRGRGRPALLTLGQDETKNSGRLEFEIPKQLANRLLQYREEIAPKVTGQRPDRVFVQWDGSTRGQETITVSIKKAVLNNIGVKMTPHQFRHLCAKLILDDNPGAYELVRQMLGHKNAKTTVNFYAGIDTRRAGKAHADLIMGMREKGLAGRRRPRRGSQKG